MLVDMDGRVEYLMNCFLHEFVHLARMEYAIVGPSCDPFSISITILWMEHAWVPVT